MDLKTYIYNKFVEHIIIGLGLIVACILIASSFSLLKNIVWGQKNIESELNVLVNFEQAKNAQERMTWEVELMRINKSVELRADTVSLFNILILAITAWAVLLYTFETRRMRKETSGLNEETRRLRIISENQLNSQRQPMLILEVRDEGQSGRSFRLRNIGDGVALKIEVSTNELQINDHGVNYPIRFANVAGLEKASELEIQSYMEDNEGNLIKLERLELSKLPWSAQKVAIKYENLIGQKFTTIMRVGRKENILDEFQR